MSAIGEKEDIYVEIKVDALDAELQKKGWPSIKKNTPHGIFFICDPQDNTKIVGYRYSGRASVINCQIARDLSAANTLYMEISRFPRSTTCYIEGPHFEIPQRPPDLPD
jgi:hypothetical protein